ncbi:MAG: hypothetical protein LKE46_03825 [Clostridium sp.]|jgi:xanthine/uracil permease|uniref:hypothetical protein n=1 Tax=Clostridium sp. TaxID=1506 RepID=UPI0025B90CC2|nr:hypothetical protein [Clostridium sp.]MCH3963378.1 hypothetical protein [Clostridium sp.]MCI1716754.1 hypothetical protein [Clostridium sp.]MCI1801062.1 hypothetical protein [Clostridium sp.]MCI1814940.1 hypothetical protein [Clostridium sp.]MCI1871841.1 hypothetical protein [Clostridium sp.]
MKEVIGIVMFMILAIYFFIRFVESKKIYNLFIVGTSLCAVFINTPFAKNISEFIENIIVSGVLIFGFLAIYLKNQEDKSL